MSVKDIFCGLVLDRLVVIHGTYHAIQYRYI